MITEAGWKVAASVGSYVFSVNEPKKYTKRWSN